MSSKSPDLGASVELVINEFETLKAVAESKIEEVVALSADQKAMDKAKKYLSEAQETLKQAKEKAQERIKLESEVKKVQAEVAAEKAGIEATSKVIEELNASLKTETEHLSKARAEKESASDSVKK